MTLVSIFSFSPCPMITSTVGNENIRCLLHPGTRLLAISGSGLFKSRERKITWCLCCTNTRRKNSVSLTAREDSLPTKACMISKREMRSREAWSEFDVATRTKGDSMFKPKRSTQTWNTKFGRKYQAHIITVQRVMNVVRLAKTSAVSGMCTQKTWKQAQAWALLWYWSCSAVIDRSAGRSWGTAKSSASKCQTCWFSLEK